mmetsp:Transcript_28645/g.65471  ORF Transcript_28645/g.65471 Transcript_28645/m.65471 type:complete len:95 (+) Transcript_28645:426-710(+)
MYVLSSVAGAIMTISGCWRNELINADSHVMFNIQAMRDINEAMPKYNSIDIGNCNVTEKLLVPSRLLTLSDIVFKVIKLSRIQIDNNNLNISSM